MTIERLFRILLVCDVALEVASLASGEPSRSPGPLLTGLWLAVIGTTIAGWIGLFSMLREGRAVYLASWLGYLLLLALGGPVTDSAGGYALQMLMALVGGAVLPLAYLSELRTRFGSLLSAAPATGETAMPAPSHTR